MCFRTFITLNTVLFNVIIDCPYRNANVGVIDLFNIIALFICGRKLKNKTLILKNLRKF